MNYYQKSRNQLMQSVKLIDSKKNLIKHIKYANKLYRGIHHLLNNTGGRNFDNATKQKA